MTNINLLSEIKQYQEFVSIISVLSQQSDISIRSGMFDVIVCRGTLGIFIAAALA